MTHLFLYRIRQACWRAFWDARWPRLLTTKQVAFTAIEFGTRNTLYAVDSKSGIRRRIGGKR